ncbi:hypothetical protein Droror1_Dr00007464 [Drosera rotundifolia]
MKMLTRCRPWFSAEELGYLNLTTKVSSVMIAEGDTLWTGIPEDCTDPNALQALDEVRKLVNEAKYVEATAVADKKLSGQPPEAYQLLGDLKLEFDHSDTAYVDGSYLRELDLVCVRYTVGDVKSKRNHFASNPYQVIVTKISSGRGTYVHSSF